MTELALITTTWQGIRWAGANAVPCQVVGLGLALAVLVSRAEPPSVTQ